MATRGGAVKHVVLAVALLAGSAPARAEAPKRPRLAVLGLRAISVDEAKVDLLSEVALTEASRFPSLDVMGRSDVAAILGFERQRQLLGCKEDAACMAELGGALGADYLLVGSLGRIGNLLRLDLRLLDPRKARVLGRFGESIEGEEDRLLTALQRGVAELVGPIGGAPPAASRTRAQPAAAAPARSAGPARVAERGVRFNGRALSEEQARTLGRLELAIGRLPDGEYWYDARTGASGRWGGPTLAFLPAGLDLGGPLPAAASGGGQGTVTGVFINGRELHPIDVLGLREILGVVLPGRWWVDSQGTYGLEGGPALGNLVLLAQQRRAIGQGGSRAWSRRYEGATPGDNMNLASDGTTTCVSVSGYSRCTGE
jgi:TolB-like protein